MKENHSISICIKSEDQTRKLAKILASRIGPGCLILLDGTLGTGKSTLARHMIRSLLNQPELEVPSPTFLLVLPYGNEEYSILHADIYRIEHPEEVEELGLFEDENAIVIVEWPQRAPWLATEADLVIHMTMGKKQTDRLIKMEAPGNPNLLEQADRDLASLKSE